MSDEERIERLELEVKVLRDNNKGLKDKIDEQSKEIEELKEYKHDAELTKIACCTAQNCEALNNCIKLERELQNADEYIKRLKECHLQYEEMTGIDLLLI